jgi:DNA-binding CsgD family transcriptional regulator
LYDSRSVSDITGKIMSVSRLIIPYTMGYFILLDNTSDKTVIDKENSSCFGMERKIFEKYMKYYYETDYIHYSSELVNHTATFRDTDIMEEELRVKTDFYLNFLKPNDIPYGAGVILCRGGKNIGLINFFRNSLLGNFTDRDMYVLNILKDHFSKITNRLIENETVNLIQRGLIATKYSLSKRESEILNYILAGYSNAEIADKLCISVSTVKKHIYSIFSKVGVNTRTQLFSALSNLFPSNS